MAQRLKAQATRETNYHNGVPLFVASAADPTCPFTSPPLTRRQGLMASGHSTHALARWRFSPGGRLAIAADAVHHQDPRLPSSGRRVRAAAARRRHRHWRTASATTSTSRAARRRRPRHQPEHQSRRRCSRGRPRPGHRAPAPAAPTPVLLEADLARDGGYGRQERKLVLLDAVVLLDVGYVRQELQLILREADLARDAGHAGSSSAAPAHVLFDADVALDVGHARQEL